MRIRSAEGTRGRDGETRSARSRAVPIAVSTAAFTGGAALLGVEIAASRVLAPFFGNSLFVWGALIGVVLAGLSVGYWVGGATADRVPAPALLVSVLVAGGLLVLAVPLVDGPVLEAIVSWNPGPRLNPLLAAAALFAAPSVILAAVTPIAIRLLADSIDHAGRTAGRLFAVSTAGSIAGTFATAFWLIPEFGTNQLLGFAAIALFAAGTVVAASARMVPALAACLLALGGTAVATAALAPESGGTLSGVAAQNWSPTYVERDKALVGQADLGGKILETQDSRYHRIYVVESDGLRYLRFDNSFQSAAYTDDPFRTAFRYTDFFHLGLAYNPPARDVLFLGLGGGSAPKRLWRDFPRVRVRVAELDPAVVEIGYRHFEIPRSPRLRIDVEDGRRYLAGRDERWDVIAVDAFYAESVPFHLTTREFLELVRSRLAPGGVVVTNMVGAMAGPGSRLFRSLYRTYRSVFPTVLVHPVSFRSEEALTDFRNIILVATERPAPRRAFLEQRWNALRRQAPTAPDLTKPIRDRYDGRVATADVPTLTDDYAPTDALLLLDG